jgi:hypothetical protein
MIDAKHDESAERLVALCNSVRLFVPFKPGMTVADVQSFLGREDEGPKTAPFSDAWNGTFGTASGNFTSTFEQAVGGRCVFVQLEPPQIRNGRGHMTLWVNSKQQFFVEMAIEENKVKNVYVVPGNVNAIIPVVILVGGEGTAAGVAGSLLEAAGKDTGRSCPGSGTFDNHRQP